MRNRKRATRKDGFICRRASVTSEAGFYLAQRALRRIGLIRYHVAYVFGTYMFAIRTSYLAEFTLPWADPFKSRHHMRAHMMGSS